jgi:hypothetical protein
MAKYAHFRTDVPGRIPTPAQLAVGEIAMNTADQILYTKTADGQIIRIGAGSYTRSEMDLRFLPQGILPITRVGDITTDALPVALNALSVQVTAAIPVLLAGRSYTLSVGDYSFSSAIAGNAGAATLRVYVTLINAQATFEFSLTSLPETIVRVYVGSIAINAQTASNLALQKVSRLDIYRPSLTEQGSSFPVSPGTPDNLSQTNW